MSDVAILIPAFNEKATIAGVIVSCEKAVDDAEIIVCDDGSTDGTGDIAEAMGVIVIKHEMNEGKGEAMRSLFKKAIGMGAQKIVTIDADEQHDPKDIPRLLEGLKDAEMVIGGREGIPTTRAVGNLFLSGFSKLDTQSGFRAYRSSVLPMLIPSEKRMAVDSEIFQKAKEIGLRITQVKIGVNYKVPNPSKSNMALHFLDVAFTRYKLASFNHPMLLYGLPGLFFMLASVDTGFTALSIVSHNPLLLPIALAYGLISVYLMIIGIVSIAIAIIIWTIVTWARRFQK